MSDFEWDVHKARTNWLKHGVAFSDAITALEDEQALTIEDDQLHEQRFITIGKNASGKILVVVYAYRTDVIPIISARKATPGEIRVYQEGAS